MMPLLYNVYLDSTEILEASWSQGTWRLTAPLPSAREGLRAAVLDNNIFIFGENIFCYINIQYLICHCIYLVMFIVTIYHYHIFTGGYLVKDIMQFNTVSHTWEEVGKMKEARHRHAVAVVADVTKLCP